jgi:leader peptidase (prepilin peptidase)/N-methyltransferase
MTALAAVVAAVLGLGAGLVVDRAARRFPWAPRKRSRSPGRKTPDGDGALLPPLHDRGGVLPTAGTALLTAFLFALVVLRFGLVWELPAFLVLAAVAVLLTLIDLRHHLLPDRVVLPAIVAGAVLLAVAGVVEGDAAAFVRAGGAALVLFVVFLVLALIAPSGLGMGDVKLAALLGLYLGWLGWNVVVLGAAAGFVVQAVLAVALLASRRIGLKGELPFGPAMLLGAALAIGWGTAVLG